VLAIHADFNAGVPLDLAIETHAQISSEEFSSNGVTVNEAINWPQLIHAFKDHKLSSGAIKQSTWDGIYWRRMAVILEAVGGKRRPVSSKQLLESVIESWKDRPGSRGRQIQVSSLLHCCAGGSIRTACRHPGRPRLISRSMLDVCVMIVESQHPLMRSMFFSW
jgi:hypothetical protein